MADELRFMSDPVSLDGPPLGELTLRVRGVVADPKTLSSHSLAILQLHWTGMDGRERDPADLAFSLPQLQALYRLLGEILGEHGLPVGPDTEQLRAIRQALARIDGSIPMGSTLASEIAECLFRYIEATYDLPKKPNPYRTG